MHYGVHSAFRALLCGNCNYANEDDENENPIKISRGEEQSFVWCFFLALFDVQGWTGQQNTHFL